jgi:hypothetical protein
MRFGYLGQDCSLRASMTIRKDANFALALAQARWRWVDGFELFVSGLGKFERCGCDVFFDVLRR